MGAWREEERKSREGKERREAGRRRRIVSFEFEERTSGRPGGKRMGAWREGERESREGKERREARRRRRIVSFEFEEVRNFCCSKIVKIKQKSYSKIKKTLILILNI